MDKQKQHCEWRTAKHGTPVGGRNETMWYVYVLPRQFYLEDWKNNKNIIIRGPIYILGSSFVSVLRVHYLVL